MTGERLAATEKRLLFRVELLYGDSCRIPAGLSVGRDPGGCSVPSSDQSERGHDLQASACDSVESSEPKMEPRVHLVRSL